MAFNQHPHATLGKRIDYPPISISQTALGSTAEGGASAQGEKTSHTFWDGTRQVKIKPAATGLRRSLRDWILCSWTSISANQITPGT